MFQRRIFAGLALAVLAIVASPARADSVCGPGRHIGAENDAPGASWQGCWPDSSPGFGAASPTISGGNRAATALQGAGAALQGASAILSIASTLASLLSATDTSSSIAVDPESYGLKAREMNRRGLEAMQEGRYKAADIAFSLAADYARDAGNKDDYAANLRNANIARAEDELKQGFALEQQGKMRAASDYYVRALYEARSAGAKDLAKQISSYNDRLVAAAGGPNAAATQGVNPTNTLCDNLNGQIICR